MEELHRQANLQHVLYSGSEGTVSASFENVPWDRVLDLVLMASGLDFETRGDVQIIATREGLRNLHASRHREPVGDAISLDFKDGDIQDILRLFADISGLNIVVLPGIQGSVTAKLDRLPWDEALFLFLNSQGLAFSQKGHILVVAEPERLRPFVAAETKRYREPLISLNFMEGSFDDVMTFFARTTGFDVVAEAEFDDLLVLKLTEVPWEQALDVILTIHGFSYRVEGGMIRVGRHRLLDTSGRVEVRKAGANEWIDGQDGDDLDVGDAVRTGTLVENSRTWLQLADGSNYLVPPDSIVVLEPVGISPQVVGSERPGNLSWTHLEHLRPELPRSEPAYLRCISCPAATFPERALGDKVSGSVEVSFTVTDGGLVAGLTLERGARPVLDEAVLRAVRSWRFHPPGGNVQWRLRQTFTAAR